MKGYLTKFGTSDDYQGDFVCQPVSIGIIMSHITLNWAEDH